MKFTHLWKRLFARTSVDEILAESAEESPDVDPLTALQEEVAELEKAVAAQQRSVVVAEKTLETRRERVESSREKAEKAETDLGSLVGARDSLADWLQERANSMALRILTHLDDETRRLKADEEYLRALSEAEPPDLSGYAERLRKAYVRGVWISIGVGVLAPPIGFGLWNVIVQAQGSEPATFSWLDYLIAGLAAFFITLLIFLASYHRGFSQMARILGTHLDQCEYVMDAIGRLRTERARVAALSTQMQERLAFLGAVLQKPWELAEEASTSTFDEELSPGFPSLMQVATASASDESTRNALRRQFIARGFTSNMRSESYLRALQLAARQEGLADDSAELAWVDSDPTMHGLRNSLLLKARSPEILQAVGAEKLDAIIAEIRQGFDGPRVDGDPGFDDATVSLVRPPVLRRNIDPLAGLTLTSDGTPATPTEAWNDFVEEILEVGSSLSPLAFTGEGRRSGDQGTYASYATLPERLDHRKVAHVHATRTGPASGRSTEVVSRVDVTEAMDAAHVSMFVFEAAPPVPGTDPSRAPLPGSL